MEIINHPYFDKGRSPSGSFLYFCIFADMKLNIRKTLAAASLLLSGVWSAAQNTAEIRIDASKPSGYIDPMLYGQLFEHIYFSPNNGVWNEMIFERSFEPEQYPGIHPRDGYFDGWFMDDEQILHSPTRYEQPLNIVSLDTDDYVIELDINWRSYRLARRSVPVVRLPLRLKRVSCAVSLPVMMVIRSGSI